VRAQSRGGRNLKTRHKKFTAGERRKGSGRGRHKRGKKADGEPPGDGQAAVWHKRSLARGKERKRKGRHAAATKSDIKSQGGSCHAENWIMQEQKKKKCRRFSGNWRGGSTSGYEILGSTGRDRLELCTRNGRKQKIWGSCPREVGDRRGGVSKNRVREWPKT